jgi:hypothetical protein
MKKLVLVLVLVLVFVFALPVLANPFADVPLNHWAYDSVQYLAAKGVIIGYPDGTFGGNRTMTRYEFAEAIARMLAYVEGMDFASADDVAVLEKLAIEFADELASLGVTVADLEAAGLANSEAIAALEITVAKHEKFFDQVVITGDLTATYTKVVVPMTVATLSDEAEITFTATINDQTTAGVTVTATDVLSGAPAYDVTWSGFFIDYKGADLQLRVGEVLPASIGLSLISHYEVDDDEFDGFLATWKWNTENDLGAWTMFGDVEDYYVLHVAMPVGEEDKIALGVTASYDQLAGGFVGGADLAFNLGDNDETSVAIEGGVFYGAALSYAAAISIGIPLDDLDLTVHGSYVSDGFVPTKSDFDDDELKVGVDATYPLTEKVDGTLSWDYAMDSAMAAVTAHTIEGDLVYTVNADTEETAELDVTYDILTPGVTAYGEYMNYPLADKFVLSGAAQYETIGPAYVAVGTLEYALAEDMDLIVEGRIDSNGTAPWSAEAQLVYELAVNTDLTVGFEMNDWEDDINDYDAMNIIGTSGTLSAGLEVTF